MKVASVVAAIMAASVTAHASAGALMLSPVQTGAETVRFRMGVPTLNLETATGAVQITPLPFDHGKVSVGVSVYNKGEVPINFGIENITAQIQGRPTVVLSSAELQKRAKSRAMWSQIGIAMLAGAAAAAASQAYTTNSYRGSYRTPRGTYRWTSTYRDNSLGVLGATAAVAGGTGAIVGIQNRLDYTLENLSNEIIQTTTIDPDASYGGQVVLEKDPKAKLPYDVRLVMSLNGTDYPFVFRVTKDGVGLPPPYIVAPVVAPAVVPAAPAMQIPAPAPVAAPLPVAATATPLPQR